MVIHVGDYLQKRGHLLQVYEGDAKRPAGKLLGLASRKLGGGRFPASWMLAWKLAQNWYLVSISRQEGEGWVKWQ